MVSSSAVILLLRSAAAPDSEPLLLKTLLFSPAARWLSMSLRRAGVERFFVVSEPEYRSAAALCFPEGSAVLAKDDPGLETALAAFCVGEPGEVITVTEPVWLSLSACRELAEEEFLTPAGDACGVFRVPASVLAEGGMETLHYGAHYSPLNDPEPQLISLHDERAFLCAREAGWADCLYQLAADGADLIDPAAVYAEPGARLGRGTTVLPGTILRGEVITGEGCVLGPNAMLTECVLGDRCVVNAAQVSFAALPDGAHAGPYESVSGTL